MIDPYAIHIDRPEVHKENLISKYEKRAGLITVILWLLVMAVAFFIAFRLFATNFL